MQILGSLPPTHLICYTIVLLVDMDYIYICPHEKQKKKEVYVQQQY